MIYGRVLGIDHGLKRIGLAVSDPSGLIARELTVLNRKTNREDFERINRIAAEQKATGIVVGLPINSEAETGEYTQADTVRRWVERFAETTRLPITLWDEQLTSADARELSIRQGRNRREAIDDLAARIILQSYLDALRDGLATPPD
ncbi:MAG: Holliday junction resolvase RuvX, partial [Anaerolineae bacterium]|nr:Holliday junction resolvase RuvX [Anaerolineae bacterium]